MPATSTLDVVAGIPVRFEAQSQATVYRPRIGSYDSLCYSRPKAGAASRTPRTAAASVALTAAIITPLRRRSTRSPSVVLAVYR